MPIPTVNACPLCKFEIPAGATVCQGCGAVKQANWLLLKAALSLAYLFFGPLVAFYLLTHTRWAAGEHLPELLLAIGLTIFGPKLLKRFFRLFTGSSWRRYSRD